MRLLTISFLVLGSVTASYAQQLYVVVGAFAQESNAQKFTGYVRSLRFSAQYELNTAKNYYYVYVLKTTERADAIAEAKLLQEQSEFKDAWVFTGRLGIEAEAVTEAVAEQPNKYEIHKPSIDEEVIELVSGNERPPLVPKEPQVEAPAPLAEAPPKVKGQLVRFVVTRLDHTPMPGTLHVVDFTRGRTLATYKSDEYIDLPRPTKGNNPMSVVCGIFGYKEELRFLDYDNLASVDGAIQDSNGAWVIPFMLERLKKGDVSVMYNVAFYKDAVVMLPQAQQELDELINLMKGNPNYKIKIHGHCNGANSRRIIALGPTKNYFNINGSDERKGTAKELSKLRAEAVRSYLEDNGIQTNRTQIYAWGAASMLVSENSPSAKLNDRIEIEILEY